ncbi:MAG: Ni/Fe hydrogenase subunit alpha [Candidatus Altiarchaeota archaeon]|nr:Ni/Fe hydrogenase subunit alpha [Candidatus Altiarchaeota archaeon]
MSEIIIDPMTRLEGHGKVTIELDDGGKVKDARFSIVYLRGFEKFLEGCALEDLPKFTPRICGVCPVAHHMASAKACDAVLKAKLTETGEKIRRLWYAVNGVHDKMLILAGTGAPDLLLPDANQKTRNVITLITKNPELGKKILELRKFGQESNRVISGKAIHPFTAVPGGVSFKVTEDQVKQIKKLGKNALHIATEVVELIKDKTYELVEKKGDLLEKLGNVETNYLGLRASDGTSDHYDGDVAFMDSKGKITEFHPSDYLNYLAENTSDYSFGKYPYWKALGFPEGIIRVGPLARLNVAEKLSTPKAQEYFEDFRKSFGRPAHVTMLYHYARAIELLNCAEMAMDLLDDPAILGDDTIGSMGPLGAGQGVGIVEAPRGTLIHHYETDEKGLVKDINLIVATTFNNAPIDRDIKAASQKLITSKSPNEKILNTIEMVARAYDPCLSCAAHSVDGGYPLKIEIYDSEGNRVGEISNTRR